MCITTVSNKKYLAHEFDIKQPKQMLELKLNMIIDENFRLINARDKNANHPLIRKYSDIPL